MGTLRVFLAISVLLHHFGLQNNQHFVFLDGGVAVILFFIVSGFYMALVINQKYGKLSSPISSFYLSRFMRIYPLYLVVGCLAYVAYKAASHESAFSHHTDLSDFGRLIIFFSNLTVFGQDVLLSVVEDIRNGSPISGFVHEVLSTLGMSHVTFDDKYFYIPQAWSVAIELQFYLIAPFIVRKPLRIVGCLAASLLVRFFAHRFGFPPVPYELRLLPTTFAFFMLGSLAYYLYEYIRQYEASKIAGWAMIASASALYLYFCITSSGIHFLPGADFDDISHWTLYTATAVGMPFLFLCTKSLYIDNFIGEFSYPIYLVHLLVLERVVKATANPGISPVWLLLIWSVMLSWFLVKAVEQPIDRFRARLSSVALPARPAKPKERSLAEKLKERSPAEVRVAIEAA